MNVLEMQFSCATGRTSALTVGCFLDRERVIVVEVGSMLRGPFLDAVRCRCGRVECASRLPCPSAGGVDKARSDVEGPSLEPGCFWSIQPRQ